MSTIIMIICDAFLVFEVPDTGEDHRNFLLISRLDRFRIFQRAAWLDDRGHASLGCLIDTVSKGEKGIGGQHNWC